MATDERTAAMDALIADSADMIDGPAAYEGLSEAMYSLSAQLAMTGWLDDDTNHAMYERVVKQWQALPEPEALSAMSPAGDVEKIVAWLRRRGGQLLRTESSADQIAGAELLMKAGEIERGDYRHD